MSVEDKVELSCCVSRYYFSDNVAIFDIVSSCVAHCCVTELAVQHKISAAEKKSIT